MTYGNTFKRSNHTLIAILATICVILVGSCWISNFNERTEVCIVTSKEVKRINKEDMYLIYTESEDGKINVYEITDSLIHFRFNSADVYGGIKEGHTYEFKVVGIRSGIMSLYPNILEYKEIK